MPDPTTTSLRVVRRLRGKSITYRRGTLRIPIQAIRGESVFNRTDQYGVTTTFNTVDWIFEADDLVDGQVLTPEAGDKIEHAAPRGTRTYEVSCPTETESSYREVGDGHWLRVHTQKVADE